MYDSTAIRRVLRMLLLMAGTRQEYVGTRIVLTLELNADNSRLHILAHLYVGIRQIKKLLVISLGRRLPLEISDILIIRSEIIIVRFIRRRYLIPGKRNVSGTI